MEFVRREYAGALPRPDWWLVRPDEIIAQCEKVKKGKSEIVAHTPGGFPVYAVTYGEERPDAREINWPSATGSPRPELYAQSGKQCLMIVAGIHGEEAEGVITVLDLMHIMETGNDLRGFPQPELAALAENFRLVLMPCVNMDGRAISPDCYLGTTNDEFRRVVSTLLKDGTRLHWPALKEYFPMPMDQVAELGTYYNSEGYNIMHDAAPGNLRTEEAKGILRTAHRERIDFFLNMHSDGTEHFSLSDSLHYSVNKATYIAVSKEWMKLRGHDPEVILGGFSMQTDINCAVELATGAPAVTYEHGLKAEGATHASLLDEGLSVVEALFRYGKDHVLADRRKIVGKEK